MQVDQDAGGMFAELEDANMDPIVHQPAPVIEEVKEAAPQASFGQVAQPAPVAPPAPV